MTLPTASRPGLSADPPRRPAEHDDAPRAAGPPAAGPPAEAVTLADLIAESGPLPADAALECVQRLAERLTLTPACSCAGLGPADVLIDDDGGVWLRAPAEAAPSGDGRPTGLDRLGRLLAFLATGEDRHLADAETVTPADLPAPLSTVAGRLFSRNGAGYRSYAELARDAARTRGVTPALDEPPAPEPDAVTEAPVEPEPPALAAEPAAAEPDREPAPEDAGPSLIGLGMIAAALAGAIIAYFLYQTL